MDELAEYGIAAHWIYKTGNKENPAQVRAKRWVNTLMEVKKNVDELNKNLEEYIEKNNFHLSTIVKSILEQQLPMTCPKISTCQI